jgi:spermidine/putrescine transport system substrate-binding protein
VRIASGRLSRRSVLAGLLAAPVSAACSSGDDDAPATPASASNPPPSVEPTTIVWANWPDYIDVDEKRASVRPTLDAYTRRSGMRVVYKEPINDSEAFVRTIAKPLAERRPVGYDILTITSWKAAQLIGAGQVHRLDRALMPNTRNLVAALAEPGYDPERAHSVPWQAGLTGIAYDARRVDRAIGSFSELLTRADLRGGVGLLQDFSDTVGMLVLAQGGDPTDIVVGDVENALEAISRLRRKGHVRAFYGNDFIDALKAGTIAAALAWSGDVLQAQLENPNIKFVVPEEGLLLWSDDLLVPRGSTRAPAVATLINHFYDPAVAARVAAYVNYICPVEGAREQMEKLDPDLAHNPLIFPDESILDRSYQVQTLPAKDDQRLRRQFLALLEA